MDRSIEFLRATRTQVDPVSGCINWTSTRSNGYGLIRINGVYVRAHRLFYEAERGPIPTKLTIDHLCRNRACVNVDHLEAVTIGENVLRGISPPAKNAKKTACSVCGGPLKTLKTLTRRCGACDRERAARVRRYKKLTASQPVRLRGGQPKLDSAQINDVFQLRSKISTQEIAIQFNVCRSTIQRVLRLNKPPNASFND